MMPKRSLMPTNIAQSLDPFRIFSRDLEKLERSFNDFWGVPPLLSSIREEISWPNIDVVEDDKAIQVIADLPGLEEKDINIDINNGIFSLRGEKKEEREENRNNYRISERSRGYFNRSFQIPAEIDESKIEATLKDGVLKVVLPKSAEANKQKKRIEIKKQ